MHNIRRLVFAAMVLSLSGGLLSAQEQPKIQEEVVVRWWLVPVYAMNKDGSPAPGLKPEDFEVYLNKTRVPFFDLHKKDFPACRRAQGIDRRGNRSAFRKKAGFSCLRQRFFGPHSPRKSKKVAKTMIAQEGQAAQFIALTIEPYSGLKTILGPDARQGPPRQEYR